MSPGRHSTDDGDLPSFTGDVPADLTLAGGVVRRRFVRLFARGLTGFGIAYGLVLGLAFVFAVVVVRLALDHLVPAIVTLLAVGVASGAAALVRPVPGPVRFLLGAVPAAGFLLAALLVANLEHPPIDHAPIVLGAAGAVTGLVYIVLGGGRFKDHFRRRATERGLERVS